MLEQFKNLAGLTVEEAQKQTDFEIRVVTKDGQVQAGDCCIRRNRINVATENGVISDVLDIG